MKSFVLHGDNRVKSRARLAQLIGKAKRDSWQVTRVDGKTTNEGELATLARSQTLIPSQQLIVVEDFFEAKKGSQDLLKRLVQQPNSTLIFWEGRTLPKSLVRKLEANFQVEEFKIPATVFKFLDAFIPENARAALRFLQKAKESDSAEFLLFMLASRVRQLTWVKDNPQTLALADWQKKKLLKQAEKWSLEQLLAIHNRLLELDRKSKTSALAQPLTSSLDLLVASL